MTYFAAALARTPGGWAAEELDLSELGDLEAVVDELRELTGDGPGPALLLLEEDDEHVAVVRVDGGLSSLDDPRVFLSDERAAQASDVAAMLWEGDAPPADGDEDDDDAGRVLAEPVGDSDLLADLGTPAEDLLALCAEEGLLPSDVLAAVCERAGCLDALEQLREGVTA